MLMKNGKPLKFEECKIGIEEMKKAREKGE